MHDPNRIGAALIAALGLLAGVALTLFVLTVTDATPSCYEDEAIVWTGDAHTDCVPIDNL